MSEFNELQCICGLVCKSRSGFVRHTNKCSKYISGLNNTVPQKRGATCERKREEIKRSRGYTDIFSDRESLNSPGSTHAVHPSLIYLNSQLNTGNRKPLTSEEIALLKVAQFVSDAGIHREHVEKLLKLLRSPDMDFSKLPKTQRTLDSRVTDLLSRFERFPDLPGSKMQEAEFDVGLINPLKPKVHYQLLWNFFSNIRTVALSDLLMRK